MSNLSEEEIIKQIEIYIFLLIKERHNGKVTIEQIRFQEAIQGLLDLYNKEKEKNTELKVLIEQNLKYSHNLEKDLFENCSNYVISKDKIREKIKELDKKAKQELKGVKGQDRYFIKQIYHSKRSFGKDLLEEE